MLKPIALGIALGLAASALTPAHAADKYIPPLVDEVVDKAAYKSPWTGLYVSGGLGLKASEAEVANIITLGDTAAAVDARLGYSVMFAPHWVASVFGQIGLDNTNYKVAGFKLADSKMNYMVGATIGVVPRSDWQVYGLVGYEWSKLDISNALTDENVDGGAWVVGAGLEVALSDHVFLGAEGTVNLGTSDTVGPIKVEASDYTGKVRLGYRF